MWSFGRVRITPSHDDTTCRKRRNWSLGIGLGKGRRVTGYPTSRREANSVKPWANPSIVNTSASCITSRDNPKPAYTTPLRRSNTQNGNKSRKVNFIAASPGIMFNLQPLLANVGNGHTAPGLSHHDMAMTHDSNRTERTFRICDDEATSSELREPPAARFAKQTKRASSPESIAPHNAT